MAVKHYKIKNGDKTTNILTGDRVVQSRVETMLNKRKVAEVDGVAEVDDYDLAMQECEGDQGENEE